jgi:hypothetical protein
MHEERPPWYGIGEWTRRGIARFRFNRSRSEWQLYWGATGRAPRPP